MSPIKSRHAEEQDRKQDRDQDKDVRSDVRMDPRLLEMACGGVATVAAHIVVDRVSGNGEGHLRDSQLSARK
jgi:hypothetical protein